MFKNEEKPKILIVDDKVENLHTLSKMLQEIEADIYQANSGDEALLMTLDNDFALILLDVKMPGMNGYEVARLIRGDKKTKHIPIIFVTANYYTENDIFEGYEAGAIDYIFKPIISKILLSKVKIFLELYKYKVEEVLKSENRYRTLFETIGIGILYLDAAENIISVNPAFEKIFNLDSEMILNKSIRELNWIYYNQADQEIRIEDLPFIKALKLGQEIHNEIIKIVTIDHRIRWINLAAVPLFKTGTDKAFQVYIIFVDITKNIKNEIEKDKIQIQLQQLQKMESIGNLASGIAHDFNNILTVIQVEAELLSEDLDVETEEYITLKNILNATKKATLLTSQLLIFGRKSILDKKSLNLNKVIESTIKMIRRLIGEDITVEIKLADNLEQTLADAGQMGQVIMNLAVNARDAMPDGGIFSIMTSKLTIGAEFCQQHIQARPGEFVLLQVSDTGSGINPGILRNIFEPFFTTKQPGKGTGLGLSVVYGIIKQHGGWIIVDSKEGVGSTFEIYLPIVKDYIKNQNGERKNREIKQVTGKILIVEDDNSLRELITKFLQQKGYIVITAEDSKNAREIYLANQNDIELVIIDVILPDDSGLNLADELKSINHKLKILLISGYTEEKINRQLINEKCYPFLRKPFSANELIDTILTI